MGRSVTKSLNMLSPTNPKQKLKPIGCYSSRTHPVPQTLSQLVNWYIKNIRPVRDKGVTAFQLNSTSGLHPTLLAAGDVINLCTYGLHFDKKSGFLVKMEPHQRRISNYLPLIEAELKHCSALSKKFKNYEEAYDFVAHIAATVRKTNPNLRFGPTATYDIAMRLYYALKGLRPKDIVYFHSGSFEGIKNLYSNMNQPRPTNARPNIDHYTIDYTTLVAEPLLKSLSKLRSDEIEDLCCVFKNELKTISLL